MLKGDIRWNRSDGSTVTYPFRLQVIRYAYGRERANFMLESDSYRHWVLLCAEKGTFAYEMGAQQGTCKFGDMILCPPGMLLWREAKEPICFFFIEFDWFHDGVNGGKIRAEEVETLGKITLDDLGRLRSTYAQLRQLFIERAPDSSLLSAHYTADLIYMRIVQHMKFNQKEPAVDPRMNKAAGWIRQHASEPLSVSFIAMDLGLTPSHFSRRFHSATGKSPIAFLTSCRLQMAQSLLIDTDYTIDHIAQLCGYQNGYYFSRVFSKHIHISPSQFRKMHQI